jgi:hypothetical protein
MVPHRLCGQPLTSRICRSLLLSDEFATIYANDTHLSFFTAVYGARQVGFVANICIAGVAQLVEHHVANVVVEGSSPFTRSFFVACRMILGL